MTKKNSSWKRLHVRYITKDQGNLIFCYTEAQHCKAKLYTIILGGGKKTNQKGSSAHASVA